MKQQPTAWQQIHLYAPGQYLREIEAGLTGLGALAITLKDAGDQPLLEPAPGELPYWDDIKITVLFDLATDPDNFCQQVLQRLLPYAAHSFSSQVLNNQDWERVCLVDFHPMQFGQRLWVYPKSIPVKSDAQIVVKLDPGLAFGSGTHATTALCLRWLEQLDLRGKTVLDYGCGSGILGIAALKLGAARVYAVDIDPQAHTATAWNAAENAVTSQILAGFPEILPKAWQADIVLANILSNTLLALADKLCDYLRPNGCLALSGILSDQAEQVQTAYQAKIEFAATQQQQEWVLLSGRKR